MRYPEFLKKGDRLGFIAPSFGCSFDPYLSCFDEALRFFGGQGYDTLTGPNCRAALGQGKSNTPELCAAEINDFLTRDDCSAALSVGGGETMCEDLSFVDFEAIAKARPRWFMGYSDNTNLTFTLPTLCDTAAVYGPCAPAFGMKPLHTSLYDALGLLNGNNLTVKNYDKWEIEALKTEENPFVPYNVTEPSCLKVFKPDGCEIEEGESLNFSGRLLGGCLDVLSLLCGTRFDRVKEFCRRYEGDGIVWFLEACDLSPVAMRRAYWQLEEAGWFDTARGFIIGRPYFFNAESFGLDRISAALPVLEKYHVPVVMDADVGHLPPMMPLICGALGNVRAEKGSLIIEHRLV